MLLKSRLDILAGWLLSMHMDAEHQQHWQLQQRMKLYHAFKLHMCCITGGCRLSDCDKASSSQLISIDEFFVLLSQQKTASMLLLLSTGTPCHLGCAASQKWQMQHAQRVNTHTVPVQCTNLGVWQQHYVLIMTGDDARSAYL